MHPLRVDGFARIALPLWPLMDAALVGPDHFNKNDIWCALNEDSGPKDDFVVYFSL